ncbi:secondary thiamine-phosphate synthase enzyme YjbQ [Halorubellus sp. PRR65]|uniref:secondary thiamine-phosphate synthase enzyme YjbQ n=1 Tax=Halorubellus sp. PRR65 TaxID=3098148 RepID=UPI002B2638D9|nr:secondary thiamine-phosphate synthase enzyme YjbQ [Halorubellus sp. PRR65]
MGTFSLETDERLTTVDITDDVRAAVPEDASGVVTVFVGHTTAGVCLQEDEHRLRRDVVDFLGEVVADEGWTHDRLDGNADSHLRAMVLGASETIPVVDGNLRTGTWQSVLFVECDGPRKREFEVQFVGE